MTVHAPSARDAEIYGAARLKLDRREVYVERLSEADPHRNTTKVPLPWEADDGDEGDEAPDAPMTVETLLDIHSRSSEVQA